jgi:hypothetical protein
MKTVLLIDGRGKAINAETEELPETIGLQVVPLGYIAPTPDEAKVFQQDQGTRSHVYRELYGPLKTT